MNSVRPKKHLGQHFLRDETIARRIVDSLSGHGNYENVLEIGPGTGVLTQFLLENEKYQWWGMDVDTESVEYLRQKFPRASDRLLEQDYLKTDIRKMFDGKPIAIIGNFPYNISSQILFSILGFRDCVTEMVGMFQKEVAMRVVAGPGGKVNGILSILCQAYYHVEYLFQVNENVFDPPPKVKSAVIRFRRNDIDHLPCNESLFFAVVKTAYNQRRKTLRNSLKSMQVNWALPQVESLAGKRAEELSVDDFVHIAQAVKQD
ncbi:MAG: 16S rRNA (adenine(1518)-N(6)/adenine(1519)-N(6))-dimethyltransferase RsmA [Bacteroidota bacterium]